MRMSESVTSRRLLSKKTVAARLSVHPGTVDRLVRENRFPKPIKFSARGACRWPEHVVVAWEEDRLAAANNRPAPTDEGRAAA